MQRRVEKLSYEEYAQLALLLCKSHEEAGEYTGIEYYRMMDGRSSKFRNKPMKKWVEKIRYQLKATPPSLRSEETE